MSGAFDTWPVTIIPSRYGGTYSGGKWLAIPLDYDEVPLEVHGGDPECMEFFDNPPFQIGKGDTPHDALESLIALLDAEREGDSA